MEISKNLIIFSLFSLHLVCMSNGKYCKPMSCSYSRLSIKYPFYIKGRKPNSCDTPGFDVHCDDKSGEALLELPSAGNFSIEYIHDSDIVLSDPDGCLPRRLMSLDLENISPFQPLEPLYYPQLRHSKNEYFQLYNCSQNYFDLFNYEKIDCLSGFGYTVISIRTDTTFFYSNSNCTFLKTLLAPPYYSFYSNDSSSRISLTWNETLTKCPLCGDYPSSTTPSESQDGIGLALGLGLGTPAAIMVGIIVCYKCKQRTNQPVNNNTNNTTSGLQSQSRAVVTGGLNQVTIDSYPVVVIGESGRLIKPDDDTCPICLSEYAPHEMLKMLPECLHRFHADCIDQWLRAKAVCPICRISPPRS